jgi:hypothetical protein
VALAGVATAGSAADVDALFVVAAVVLEPGSVFFGAGLFCVALFAEALFAEAVFAEARFVPAFAPAAADAFSGGAVAAADVFLFFFGDEVLGVGAGAGSDVACVVSAALLGSAVTAGSCRRRGRGLLRCHRRRR